MQIEIKVKMNKCQKCNHVWKPKLNKPRQCPKCKSAYWDIKK